MLPLMIATIDDDADRAFMTRIYYRYRRYMYKTIGTFVSDPWDADDIFQEVFLQTVRKRPVFDSEEHEKAWLLRVTLNCLKSHWRMAWRRHDTPLDDRIPFPEPEDSALDEALRPSTARQCIYSTTRVTPQRRLRA